MVDATVADGADLAFAPSTAVTKTIKIDASDETDGNVKFTGGSANDTFEGGVGDDTFIGGAGADSLKGGTGDDVFSYTADADGVDFVEATSNADVITGFVTTGDDLSFSGDFASASLTGTAQAGVNSIVYNAGIDFNAAGSGDDSVFVIGSGANTAAAADLLTLADLNTAIGALTNDDVADERILVFQAADNTFAAYKFTSTVADNAITAPELELLATGDAAIVAADITAA